MAEDEHEEHDEVDEVDEESEGNGADREPPPAEVSRDLFLVWRFPRTGMRNPHRMTNPVWVWLAQQRELSAYGANARFDGPSSLAVGPGWCANRFGRTETRLPDGRVVEIGGEHEDYYDPDFFIYNDVVVTHPTGALDIHGYPHEAFPPTDFHTATLVGERIVIVGCLGYSWLRVVGHTPVFALDVGTLVMSRVDTTGDAPGWIHKHAAELVGDGAAIVVRGGQRLVERDGGRHFVENIDDWSLDLASGVWTRLTDRRWPQWELAREDGKSNELFAIGSGAWHVDGTSDFDREQLAGLEQQLGWLPDFALYAARYAPPVPHAPLVDEDEWDMTRISVDGVKVRYREDSASVHVMIEGSLPADTAETIVEDARRKLEALERVPYVVRRIAG